MTFAELRTLSEDFRASLREATGRDLIAAVTVDEPIDPQDELHFIKLISWCYVLLFEASQPTLRYILSLLRASNSSEHKLVSTVLESLNNLRTVRVHNLSSETRSGDYKKRQADIWLIQKGGDPTDWIRCCDTLCSEVASAIQCLGEKWHLVTTTAEDSAAAIESLIATIDQEWPAHTFDPIVESAANEIGLRGLDCVMYRQSRLERWRELVAFFESRDSAEVAIKKAILRELAHTFGAKSDFVSPDT